jgi:hypothetical protein
MGKIDDLKLSYNVSTEEDLLSINYSLSDNQIDYRDIDAKIVKALNRNKPGKYDEPEESKEKLEDLIYELEDIHDDVSRLDQDLDNTIEWGNEWKNLCLYLIEHYDIDIDTIR